MPVNEPTQKKVNFNGLKTQDESWEVGFDGFVIAENIDLSRKSKVSRRPGRADTTYVPGGTIHTAWADSELFIFQEGTSLLRFRSATNVTTLRTGLSTGGDLTAHRGQDDRVYWSNGFETGVIDLDGNNRGCGVGVPSRDVGVIGSGNLCAGRYTYTFTFVESDGRESGAPLPTTVEIADDESGLTFSLGADLLRRFYISEANGTLMYLASEVPVGATSFNYRAGKPSTNIPLDRLLMAPPPAWNDIDWYRASLLFAVDDLLVYSEDFNYELVDQSKNFLSFGQRIHTIAAVEDGFYVGTGKAHYWLTGTDMASLSLLKVANYGSVPGTKVYVDGTVVGSGEATEELPIWATKRGFVVGLPGGTLKNVHEREVDFPVASSGTALYRNANTQNHYIAVVRS